jgi:hypothetical protein
MKTLGFIGTGGMGQGMAANLIKAGYNVVVNDLNREQAKGLEEQGAQFVDTPKGVAESCDPLGFRRKGPVRRASTDFCAYGEIHLACWGIGQCQACQERHGDVCCGTAYESDRDLQLAWQRWYGKIYHSEHYCELTAGFRGDPKNHGKGCKW